MTNVWNYRADTSTGEQLAGFAVEASDGHIGKIDEATSAPGRESFVVDTGFWIFGKKRVIPAGVVSKIDAAERTVHITMTKDQVKDAPDWHENWGTDNTIQGTYGDYYGQFGL